MAVTKFGPYNLQGRIARIFQGGVQFAEILLLTTPTLKNYAHYSQTKSHSIEQLYCSPQESLANSKYMFNEHIKNRYIQFLPSIFQRHNNSHEFGGGFSWTP